MQVEYGVRAYQDGIDRGIFKQRKDFLDLRVAPNMIPILVHHYLGTPPSSVTVALVALIILSPALSIYICE